MVAKPLIVAVFLLGASWAQRGGAYDRPALDRDMAAQCIRNGGVEAYNKVERAIDQLSSCYITYANGDKLLQEVEEAKKLNRSVNEVFKKYCSTKSQYFGCVTEVAESLKPCYKTSERARGNLDVVRNVVGQLLEFICQEDGAVATSFVAAGGLQCIQHPGKGLVLLEGCVLGLQLILPQHTNNTINDVLDIDFDDSTCAILYKFQQCVVQELMTCSQEVGNTAQSLIRSLRITTPCKYKPNSASALTVTMLSSVMAALCLLLV